MEKKFSKNEYVKEYYDKSINSKIKNYEYQRWFSSMNNFILYQNTYHALSKSLSRLKFTSVLELGAGSGVWSKLLFFNSPKTQLVDVDISKEMINLHKKFFPDSKAITYENKDFTTMSLKKFENKFDLFYSIRCIEYIEDFNLLFSNINTILKKNGYGVVITKKSPFIKKRKQHSINNGIDVLKKSLKKSNLKLLSIAPVSYQIPIPFIRNSSILNSLLNKSLKVIFGDKLTWFNYIFLETYIVNFKKK